MRFFFRFKTYHVKIYFQYGVGQCHNQDGRRNVLVCNEHVQSSSRNKGLFQKQEEPMKPVINFKFYLVFNLFVVAFT
jgi:hypothetical protein